MNGGTALRQGKAYRALRRVLAVLLGAEDFRVVHLSIRNNHLHLIIEAANKRALSRGMQRFSIRAARELQATFGWCGKIFPWRYHAKQITNGYEARSALAYVLNNWRRHREDQTCMRAIQASIDPYSSGIVFDGWTERRRFAIPNGYEPLPVSPPQTSLLRSEWRRYGLIDPFERPGARG